MATTKKKPTTVKKIATKIAVANNKGGVLKTTLTVNMAVIKSASARVLIIDTDPQANAAETWGFTPDDHFQEKTLTDVLEKKVNASEAIHNLSKNLDILSANTDLAHASYSPEDMVKVIRELENKYDYIFFDTNPGINVASTIALALADKIIIPSQMETYSVRGVIKLVKGLLAEDIKPYAVVPTLFDGRSSLHKDGYQELAAAMGGIGIIVTQQSISKSTAAPKAIANSRVPLYSVNPKATTSKQIAAIVKELKI